jgi:hypothetical protein
MLRKLLFSLLLLATSASASTLAGTARDINGNALAGAKVKFDVYNCAYTPVKTADGTSVSASVEITANGSGVISGTIVGNDAFTCGATGWYVVTLRKSNGTIVWRRNYDLTDAGTWDIETAPQKTTFPLIPSLMNNVLTTAGDLVVGGTFGIPTRLGVCPNAQVLQSNGTSWACTAMTGGGGSAPGGAPGQVQVNVAGVLGAYSGLAFDGTSLTNTGKLALGPSAVTSGPRLDLRTGGDAIVGVSSRATNSTQTANHFQWLNNSGSVMGQIDAFGGLKLDTVSGGSGMITGAYIGQSAHWAGTTGSANAVASQADRLRGAGSRYTVSSSNLGGGGVDQLFTGAIGNTATCSTGVTCTVTIDFNPFVGWTPNTNTGFVYPAGLFAVNTFGGGILQNLQVELYYPTAGVDGWNTIKNITGNTKSPIVFSMANSALYIKQIRFTFSNSSTSAFIQSIEWFPFNTNDYHEQSFVPRYANLDTNVAWKSLNIKDPSWVTRTTLNPRVANGGSAVAYLFDTQNTLTTTAKIASFKNAGTEVAFINQAGALSISSTLTIGDSTISAPSGGSASWAFTPGAGSNGNINLAVGSGKIVFSTLGSLGNSSNRWQGLWTTTIDASSSITASNLGMEFTESDTNPTCAAGNYTIYADLSETKLKKCTNGVVTDLSTGVGGSSAFNDITGGTNTAAAMIVGSGASLTVSGSGTINATSLGGATFASPTSIGSTTPGTGTFSTLTATGASVVSNLGVEFVESDTNPACAAGNFNIFADLSENKLKKCMNGVATDLDTGGGGSALFTSFQVDSNTAITGSSKYFQLVSGSGISSNQSGTGTVGDPYIATLTAADATTGSKGIVALANHLGGTSASPVVLGAAFTGKINFTKIATPGVASAAGSIDVYAKTGTDQLCIINSSSVETCGGAGGVADPGGNGVMVRTATNVSINRTLTGTSNNLSITNGDGVSGNPTFAVSATLDLSGNTSTAPVKAGTTPPGTCVANKDLFIDTDATSGQQLFLCNPTANGWILLGDGGSGSSLVDPGSNGMLSRTALNSTVARTLTGTSNKISVTDGTGVSGNPTFTISDTLDLSGNTSTAPIKAGTSAPGTCVANKDLFIDTDATAGQQLLLCNSGGNGFNLVGDGGGTLRLDQIAAPTANTSITVPSANTIVYTWGNATGSANFMTLQDATTNGSATGALLNINLTTGSTVRPLRIERNGSVFFGFNQFDQITAFPTVSTTSGGLISFGGQAQFKSGDTGGTNSGALILKSGDNSATSANGTGAVTLNSGNETGATGSTSTGNVTIGPGGVTSASGTNGSLILNQTFQKDTTVTNGLLQCFKAAADRTVGDCLTTSTNWLGVATSANNTNPVVVQTYGIATLQYDNTYSPSAGWFACISSTTAAKVKPQPTACTAGLQVGIVADDGSSVTSGLVFLQVK